MNARVRHVGIYEPNADGHRLKYVQYLIKHLLTFPEVKITLVTIPSTLKSRQFAMLIAPYSSQLAIHLIDTDNVKTLRDSANACNTDLMVVPDSDALVWGHLWRTGWTGTGRLVALVMRPTGQSKHLARKAISTAAKRALIVASRCRRRVSVYQLSSALEFNRRSTFTVPDPISFEPNTVELAELWPGVESTNEIFWVGVVGVMSSRKNVPLILQAAKKVEKSNFGIVLAGSIDSQTWSAIQGPLSDLKEKNVPVVVIDQMLTDGQLDAVLKKLHCVVLAHSNEGPSGILGKAVEGGTLIVAAGATSLRRDCRKIRHMSIWCPLDERNISQSIKLMLDTNRPSRTRLNTEGLFVNRLLGASVKTSPSC